MKLSLIVPLYNRPQELQELLESLKLQTQKTFEVIIVEDGSEIKGDKIIEQFKPTLDIKYYFKPNSGPGTSRNYGSERATGDYFIFLDSDCIIPEHYIESVVSELQNKPVDAFGGPDRAHSSFSDLQKAINYSMTSFFTTGGIRGSKKSLEKFHPRSFNMGYSREVFEKTGGFSTMRFGEDIDMSIRIHKNNFSTRLFPKSYVYHKRRTSFKKFYKQVYNSGIARINLFKLHPESLKIVHLLPMAFTIGTFIVLLLTLIFSKFFILPILLYFLIIFIDSTIKNHSIVVGILGIPATFIQLCGYGIGFLEAFVKRIIFKRGAFSAFTRNFYK